MMEIAAGSITMFPADSPNVNNDIIYAYDIDDAGNMYGHDVDWNFGGNHHWLSVHLQRLQFVLCIH